MVKVPQGQNDLITQIYSLFCKNCVGQYLIKLMATDPYFLPVKQTSDLSNMSVQIHTETGTRDSRYGCKKYCSCPLKPYFLIVSEPNLKEYFLVYDSLLRSEKKSDGRRNTGSQAIRQVRQTYLEEKKEGEQ